MIRQHFSLSQVEDRQMTVGEVRDLLAQAEKALLTTDLVGLRMKFRTRKPAPKVKPVAKLIVESDAGRWEFTSQRRPS